MKSPWEFFSLEELKCPCKECVSTGMEMDNDFMQKIVALRKATNLPFLVTSAYRCKRYNNLVSHTGLNGPHTTGMAMDIGCNGTEAYKLSKMAFIMNMYGIGISQKGNASRFIHLDDCKAPDFPRPSIWSY